MSKYFQADLSKEKSNASLIDALATKTEANEVLTLLEEADETSKTVIQEIYAFTRGLETGKAAEFDQAVSEGEMLKQQIMDRNDALTTPREMAEVEKEASVDIMEAMGHINIPVKTLKAIVVKASSEIDDMFRRVDDINQYIDEADEKSETIHTLNQDRIDDLDAITYKVCESR